VLALVYAEPVRKGGGNMKNIMIGLLNIVSWALTIGGALSLERETKGGLICSIVGLVLMALCIYLEWMYSERERKRRW